MIFSQSVLIRESHLDTFGHVNNATFLQLFEQARWDIIDARGYGLRKIEETGLGPVVLEIQIRFSREIRLRETIEIRSETAAWNGSKTMSMTQSMFNAKGEACCVAQFLFGLFDTKQRKLVRPTPEWCFAVGVESA